MPLRRRRPPVVRMFDSVDVDVIPRGAVAVAGYTGGHWPTYPVLLERFPGAAVVAIAVTSRDNGLVLDIESGDATPSDFPAWWERQRARGIHAPGYYCSLSVSAEVHRVTQRAGIPRDQLRVWLAHWNGVPHLCTRGGCPGAAEDAGATQWTNRYLGRNLDASEVTRRFLPAHHRS